MIMEIEQTFAERDALYKDRDEAISRIASLAPDLIITAAYGKILPQAMLDIPKYGCINIHGSLLPKLRGAAPIQRAVIDGEKETGVTSMLMDVGLDTGDNVLETMFTGLAEYIIIKVLETLLKLLKHHLEIWCILTINTV